MSKKDTATAGDTDTPVVDVWGQHPTREFYNHEMFASLWRWQGIDTMDTEIPADWTV
ncbi:MAG: hypothetical protein ABEI77_06820 [Halorientalis sp.]